MITRPLNLAAHLSKPPLGLDPIPFIDVLAVALFFVLLSSRFVLPPGILLTLPSVENLPRDVAPTSRLLTVSESQGAEMLIFEGQVCNLAAFERILAGRAEEFAGEVLLIRSDRDVSLSVLARVWELCVVAGFERVLLAAEPEKRPAAAFP